MANSNIGFICQTEEDWDSTGWAAGCDQQQGYAGEGAARSDHPHLHRARGISGEGSGAWGWGELFSFILTRNFSLATFRHAQKRDRTKRQ